MVVESLNDRIIKKFWELQDAQRFITGPNFADSYEESRSKWVDFNQEIKAEIEEGQMLRFNELKPAQHHPLWHPL